MEYMLVIRENIVNLPNAVQAYLDEGWKPQGGPFVTTMDGKWVVAQAIVRTTIVVAH